MTSNNTNIQADYTTRINRVFEYIDENLDTELSLNTIAEIAFFSPFHFHRVFKFITNETLNQYVTRRRIEKSALDLLHKNIPVTEISLKHGFGDISSFSRAFKKFYGVSPTEFQRQNPNRFSKIRQLESKIGQPYPELEKYICVIDNLKNWIKMNATIEVKQIPKMELAYVSTIGPQNLGGAFQKLILWATPKGLMSEQTKMATVYFDSFKVTEPDKVRMNACILLNEEVEVEGKIGLTTIEAQKCIVGSFEISLHEFEKSWTGLFVWMNENGYKKAENNPFEIYHNNFNEHPERKAIVDFCIPVE
ncbi:AraC family transcriptional regulator [Flagellimonas onchidii]|uniref:AraC family transcriptional regulator n=1 Tax=Flagellimonas onchidii TaxID=2562684 RepID=UPI0010A6AA6A|nr:GyrI-like domain-containing protein [Allomuricauda onchidii]